MCGIAGFFTIENSFSENDLHQMTNAISHRGPDAYGYYNDEVVGLGHRRLSIIDLSTNANQPMHSSDNRYVIVYNGEVYNFREIAAELRQNFKTEFKTASDTEVLLEAYANYGAEMVSKLNGMFAFAIYDKEKQELFVCRDRMGIKPLYYFYDGRNFVFSSELKSFQNITLISKEIDPNAVYKFLHLGYIPAPYTIYKATKKLQAGNGLKITNDSFEQKQYWSLNQIISKEIVTSEKQALVKLSDLLMSSVQYQIKSDVPFGVFLSGGIDSSLVTANAVNLSGVKVNTFSIGFEENRYNESIYAKAVANYLGTNHHEFIVSYKDAIELIDTVFDAYSEPFSDSSAIPTLLVSKLARQHVTVTLSGEGGDELFFGYGAYIWAQRLQNPFFKNARHIIASTLPKLASKYIRHANYFDYEDERLIYSNTFSTEQNTFSTSDIEQLLSEDFKRKGKANKLELLSQFGIEIKHLNRKLTAMEEQAMFDLHFYLQDDLLTKVDRASMHYSLETRVPYLDHRIVEFALNLSPDLKFKNGTAKYLLKEILYQYVPKRFFDRPKQGFAIPLEQWLRNELSFLIDEYLSETIILKYNFVKYELVNSLIMRFRIGKESYLYNRLWLLIVLHKWMVEIHE
jgi:asparagine synthase (glutamine-hydrolysing)